MRWLVLPVALCAVSPAAFAMDPSLRGFYIGGAIGHANTEFEDDWSGQRFNDGDTGYKLIVGYRIIDWVAVEVNYSDYGDPVDQIFGYNVHPNFNGTSVSALGMLPLGQFDLFGRLGISRVEGDFRVEGFYGTESHEETEPMIGLGAQFRANPNLAIRLEVEGVLLDASNDDDDDDDFWGDDWDEDDEGDWVTMMSLGFTYKF